MTITKIDMVRDENGVWWQIREFIADDGTAGVLKEIYAGMIVEGKCDRLKRIVES